jgi:CheY-like chemotaxis protein
VSVVSLTVLVVDDDPVSRRLIRDILESAEFVVQEAADGTEGLAQAERLQPDVILLDILMPGLDGYETCARLRTHPATRAIPVVFVTSSPDSTVNRRAYTLGVLGCIPKPFRREALVAMVQTALAGRLPHRPSA